MMENEHPSAGHSREAADHENGATVALDVVALTKAIAQHRDCMDCCGTGEEPRTYDAGGNVTGFGPCFQCSGIAAAVVAADPRRTEAEVRAEERERLIAAVQALPTTQTQAFRRGWESVALGDVLDLLGAERIGGE